MMQREVGIIVTGNSGTGNAASGYVVTDQPALVVGVTGHMDPENEGELTDRVRQVLLFLRHGKGERGLEAREKLKEMLPGLVNVKLARKTSAVPDPGRAYDEFFESWPGMGETPIIVLSSLAPGADQIVAKVALDMRDEMGGFELRCPLPFPLEIYRRSSSFVKVVPATATTDETTEIEKENEAKQAELGEIIKRIDPENDCFAVAMEKDLELLTEELEQLYVNDLTALEAGGRKRRHLRYQAAGEYIAGYSHVMLAVWDHIDDTKNDEGTAGIVYARRYGLTYGLLPTTQQLPLPTDGPTFHLYTKRKKRATRETQHPETAKANPTWQARWLFAYTNREQLPKPYGNSLDPADAQWQQGGLTRFLRRSEQLVAFGNRDHADAKSAARQLKDLLSDEERDLQTDLESTAPGLFSKIKHLADFRRRAADEQRDNEAMNSLRTLVWLFWLTLFAASISHAFNHWHSQLHAESGHDEHVAAADVESDHVQNVELPDEATPSNHEDVDSLEQSKPSVASAPQDELTEPAEQSESNVHNGDTTVEGDTANGNLDADETNVRNMSAESGHDQHVAAADVESDHVQNVELPDEATPSNHKNADSLDQLMPSVASAPQDELTEPAKQGESNVENGDTTVEEVTANGNLDAGEISDRNLSAEPSVPNELQDVESVDAVPAWYDIADRFFRFAIGLVGFSLAALAIWYFSRRRPAQHNEKSDDLRAIAEASRVQLMWHMAGVGKSVSANYMQRQRGELSWIRNTISAISFPYEQAKWQFDKLDHSLQVGLLRCVYYNWIRGRSGAQANYYENKRVQLVHRIHFWHKLGSVLALAGLGLALLQVMDALVKVFGPDLFALISWAAWKSYSCWLLIIPTAVLACVLLTVRRHWKSTTPTVTNDQVIREEERWIHKWCKAWEAARLNVFDHWLESWIPTEDAKEHAHDASKFAGHMRSNFEIYATRGIVIAVFALLLGTFFANWCPFMPSLSDWVIILAAWLVICGGLCLAWPERNLCSELAYQYGTMQSLFELAADRIEPMIDELEETQRVEMDRCYAGLKACHIKQTLPAAEQATFDRETCIDRLQGEAKSAYPQQLRRIQLALYDLGTEALDENAEWLILHRARPLEPVMAG